MFLQDDRHLHRIARRRSRTKYNLDRAHRLPMTMEHPASVRFVLLEVVVRGDCGGRWRCGATSFRRRRAAARGEPQVSTEAPIHDAEGSLSLLRRPRASPCYFDVVLDGASRERQELRRRPLPLTKSCCQGKTSGTYQSFFSGRSKRARPCPESQKRGRVVWGRCGGGGVRVRGEGPGRTQLLLMTGSSISS
jgi:hypothetical protein